MLFFMFLRSDVKAIDLIQIRFCFGFRRHRRLRRGPHHTLPKELPCSASPPPDKTRDPRLHYVVYHYISPRIDSTYRFPRDAAIKQQVRRGSVRPEEETSCFVRPRARVHMSTIDMLVGLLNVPWAQLKHFHSFPSYFSAMLLICATISLPSES